MNYRYAVGWARSNPVARAIASLCPWNRITCRAGDFWPGISEPIPQGSVGGDFTQICRTEARALWRKYDEIAVMWSGGVDSCLVACLLAESKPIGAKLILASEEETLQWQQHNVLEWLVASGCEKLVVSTEALRGVVDRGGMVVTGYHADTLLCGDIIRYNDLYASIWDMSVEGMFVQATGLPLEAVRHHLDDLEPLLALMPLPRTAANVAWWLDYTCAWNSDAMALKFVFDLEPPGIGYVNFFGAPSFQLWSMQEVEHKVDKTAETHKRIYRELIAEIVGFTPNTPLRTEPGETFGSSMDMSKVLAIREDWTVVETPI